MNETQFERLPRYVQKYILDLKEDIHYHKAKYEAAASTPEKVEPDVPIPSPNSDITTFGYLMGSNNVAMPAWSTSRSHGFNINSIGIQGPKALFSSRSLALKASRYEIFLEYVRKLDTINQVIETAEKAEKEE